MNLMNVDGYQAFLEYDPDIDMFRGEILALNGGADFYGTSLDELRDEFKNSLAVFLEVCQEKGISPFKKYSGQVDLKITPELHSAVETKAAVEGKPLNQWITDLLQQRVYA